MKFIKIYNNNSILIRSLRLTKIFYIIIVFFYSELLLSNILILDINNKFENKKNNISDTIEIYKTYTIKDNIVVTATRKQLHQLDLPFSVTQMSQDNIQFNNSRSTPEALIGQSGVFIQKTNHGGGSPFIRGLTGFQTLILVDGIRLNNSTFRSGPNQYLNTIDPNSINNIEILRGGGSVQYGTDAIGGTLQLFTKNPNFSDEIIYKLNGQLKSITNNQEYSGRTELEFNSKNFAFLGGISYQKFGNIVGGKNTGVQLPSAYDQISYDAKLNYKISDNSILTLYSNTLEQQNVPLTHRVQLENFQYYYFEPQYRNTNYIKFNSNFENAILNTLTFTLLNSNWKESRVSKRNNNINETNENDDIRTLGGILELNSKILDNWSASTGIEYYNDLVNSSKLTKNTDNNNVTNSRGLYPDNSIYNNLSLFSMHTYKLNNIIIDAGIRYSYVNINMQDANLGNIKFKTNSLVWNIGLVYKINNYNSIFSLISTSFRAPNIDDMGTLGIVDFRYEVPNYNLSSEKSLNTELGYKFINENTFFTLSFYRNNLFDFINRIRGNYNGLDSINGYPVFLKTNSFESYIQGIELDFQKKITESIDLTTNFTYTYGQNVSAKEPMRRIPPLNGRIALNYSLENFYNFNIKLESIFADSQFRLASGDKSDNRINPNGTAGFAILNIASQVVFNNVRIVAGIENIFDKDYRFHGSGINGIGRSGYLKFIFNNIEF